MNIERVARTLVGAAALCGLLVSAGCNGGLSSNNSGGQPSGGTPVPSVKAPGDWGASMLAGGTVGVGMAPAKFNWDVNAAPSCANDYVAFNTGLAGVSPTAAASQTATFPSANNTPAGTFTITHGATAVVLTASTVSNAGLNFLVVNNTAPGNTTNATNLAAAIVRNGAAVTATATSAANVVTISAQQNGIEGNTIGLTKSIVNARLTLGGAALTGGVGTGNIVAFNNLYATQGSATGLCPQDGPSVYWSYFTGAATAVTSIVLSGDGAKVAFVENVGTNATLRILKWNAGDGAATGYPVAPTNTLAAGMNWSTCPAGSCVRNIAFSGGPATDTKSSPFYVYTNNADVLYVGDDSGRVHKFTGVFNGAPSEVTAAPWPITVNAGAILTSPIYESGSGNIFVGDSTGRLSFIQEVGSTVGGATPCTTPLPATIACLNTVNLAVGTGGAIVDAPVVDGTTGMVFAVNGTETSSNGRIVQANTALVSQGSFAIGGSAAAGSAFYSGAFDNAYITSAAGNTLGHMYVCGKEAANADRPAIYQLSFTAATGVVSGVGATPFIGLTNGNTEACSPITEFFNSGTDWIFFSVGANMNPSAAGPVPAACRVASIGCVLSVNVTSGTWPPAAATNGVPTPSNPAGATSGFVVDNVSASAQTSNIYFSLAVNSVGGGPGLPSCNTTTGVGCAVKLTQSGLN